MKQNHSLAASAKLTATFGRISFQTGIIIIPHQAAALVHIYLDGSVLVIHGGCELGQGLYTKMIQVR